jgi:hypothetical protein
VAAAAAAPAPSETPAADKLAALTQGPSQGDLTKSVQSELRRVGCLSGPADGDWNTASQRSLSAFNRHAGTKLDVRTVTADTLGVIRQKQSRVCPLVCEHGLKADGDHCTKIVCADGFFLNEDNQCEKQRGRQTRTAKRDPNERPAVPPQRSQATAARPQGSRSSGQIFCNDLVCRPVKPGCHIESSQYAMRGAGGLAEVCN